MMYPVDEQNLEATNPSEPVVETNSALADDPMTTRPGSAGMVVAPRRGTRLRPPPALTPSAMALANVLRYRWKMAAGLGLGVSLLVAGITWLVVPKPKTLYGATALMLMKTSEPRLAFLEGGSENLGYYRRTQIDLLKAQLIHKLALAQPKAAELKSVKENPDKVLSWLAEDLKVESGGTPEFPSQIIKLMLTGPDRDEVVTMVNAVKDAYLNGQIAPEREARKDQLAKLEDYLSKQSKQRADKQQEYNELLEKVDTEKLNEEKRRQHVLDSINQKIFDVELSIMSEKVRTDLSKQDKGAPTPRPEATPQLIEELVGRDGKLQQDLAQLRAVSESKEKYRRLVTNPEKLPEYQDYIEAEKTLTAAIEARKKEVRSFVQKEIQRIYTEATPKTEAGDNYLAELEATKAGLMAKAREEEKKLREVADENRKATLRTTEKTDRLKADLESINKAYQKISDRVEALRLEVNAPPRITSLQDATDAELIPSRDANNAIRLVGMAGIGSLALTVLGVGWWEFRSRRIHTADEVVGQLGMRMIGTLPALPEDVRRQPVPVTGTQDMYWSGRLSESIDSICTLLMHEASQVGARVLMVTSAVGHEGKTTLAAHLAASLARAGRRTLLVDGDLVHPAAHALFEEPLEPGLSDLLRGQAGLPDVIRPTAAAGLWLVPAGHADAQVVQALARDAAQPLLERLRAEYDVIVVDSSPVLPLAHSLLLGKHVDAAVLTVRKDVSRILPVYAAHQRLATLGIPVLGAVFVGASNVGYDNYIFADASGQQLQLQS